MWQVSLPLCGTFGVHLRFLTYMSCNCCAIVMYRQHTHMHMLSYLVPPLLGFAPRWKAKDPTGETRPCSGVLLPVPPPSVGVPPFSVDYFHPTGLTCPPIRVGFITSCLHVCLLEAITTLTLSPPLFIVIIYPSPFASPPPGMECLVYFKVGDYQFFSRWGILLQSQWERVQMHVWVC